MKTIEEIARDQIKREELDGIAVKLSEERDALAMLRRVELAIVAAIKSDRAQRAAEVSESTSLIDHIADALEDRARGWDDDAAPAEDSAAYRAATALRAGETEEEWDRYIGPMLDALEKAYG